MEIESSGSLDCEKINKSVDMNPNDFRPTNECFLMQSESPAFKQHPSSGTKLDPISASNRRCRRNCLTKLPSGQEKNDSLHSSKAVNPFRINFAGGRIATPTKERALVILSSTPHDFAKDPLLAEMINTKLELPVVPLTPVITWNQNQEDPHTTPIHTKGPTKRRVRSSYGVRLESIRAGITPSMFEDNSDIRKVRSNDEYQSHHRQRAKLSPLTLVLPGEL